MKLKKVSRKILFYELSRVGKSFLTTFFYGKKVVPIKPIFISLEMENTCFFHCQHCDMWKNKKNKKRMDLEEMKEVLIKLKNWLGTFQLNLTGGEPFLNRDIIPFIKFASDQGVLVHVNSNGFLINKKLAKEIVESELNSLSISLDTLDSKLFNQLRGNKEAFKKAVKAFRMINIFRKSKKPFLSISTLIMKQNLNDLKKLVFFAKKNNIDSVFFQPLCQNFNANSDIHWFKSNPLWPDNSKKINKILEDLIQMKRKSYLIGNMKSNFYSSKLYFNDPMLFSKSKPCLVGVNNFNIDSCGGVRLCFNFSSIGNILKDEPQDIWNGEKAQKQRLEIAKCKRECKVLLCNNFLNRFAKIFRL